MTIISAAEPPTVGTPTRKQLPEASREHLVTLDLGLEPAYYPGGEPMDDVFVLFAVEPDGTLAPSRATPVTLQPCHLRGRNGRMPRPPHVWTPDEPARQLVPSAEQPRTVRAVWALQSAMAGDEAAIDTFALDVLRLGRSDQWRNAASTALLGDWAAPLFTGHGLPLSAVDRLRAETRDIHRQLTSLWRHRINGERIQSLDFPFGDGLTTYDMIALGPDPYEALTGLLPDDRRVAAVLGALTRIERAVALAWADSKVTSWTEAASSVLALAPAGFAGIAPAALGARVRRKLRRLGDRYAARAAAAAGPSEQA
ncbi:hypothetical protein AB0D34_12500 [Streptomyces sp. NPDC048420]|uniref:hypothetical protein n=1 Tax=Streptomyces sp. NPDC048420 TaxID=3155755 RepID=UPI0034457CA0